MPNMTGNALIQRVQNTLLDETGVQWLVPELLRHLSAGLKAVVIVKPMAYMATTSHRLAKGTRQELPAGTDYLSSVTRNLGANGVTPGRAIRKVDIAEMDRADPDWHATPQSSVVEVFMYDERDKGVFWVYPPQQFPPGYVELYGPGIPPPYVDGTQPLPVDDNYEDALYFYVLANAYAKNAKRGDTAKAGAYMQMFFANLGASTQAQAAVAAMDQAES